MGKAAAVFLRGSDCTALKRLRRRLQSDVQSGEQRLLPPAGVAPNSNLGPVFHPLKEVAFGQSVFG